MDLKLISISVPPFGQVGTPNAPPDVAGCTQNPEGVSKVKPSGQVGVRPAKAFWVPAGTKRRIENPSKGNSLFNRIKYYFYNIN